MICIAKPKPKTKANIIFIDFSCILSAIDDCRKMFRIEMNGKFHSADFRCDEIVTINKQVDAIKCAKKSRSRSHISIHLSYTDKNNHNFNSQRSHTYKSWKRTISSHWEHDNGNTAFSFTISLANRIDKANHK